MICSPGRTRRRTKTSLAGFVGGPAATVNPHIIIMIIINICKLRVAHSQHPEKFGSSSGPSSALRPSLYVYIYIYMYRERERERELHIYIYIYNIYVYIYIYLYIYIYIERERDIHTYICLPSSRRASRPWPWRRGRPH